jgi:hypothetical protein
MAAGRLLSADKIAMPSFAQSFIQSFTKSFAQRINNEEFAFEYA